MDTVKLKINGIEVEAPQGSTILEAARLAHIDIPTLCYLKDINAIGACRVCVCEVKGARSYAAACVYPVTEGMEVFTNTPKIRAARKKTIELILSTHRRECLSCVRSGNCELQKLAQEYGCDEHRYETTIKTPDIVDVNDVLIRDNSKCVLCRRCVAACKYNQGVAVIGANERGYETHIAPAFDMPLAQAACISCGQCITVCPTGALRERDDTDKVWKALNDPTKHVVVGTAPAVRAQIGEEFGYPMGTNTEGKMTAALRRLGFDGVFDVDTAADFTIMEEGTEFISRFTKGEKLPLITSCSPGWIKYCEYYYPEFIENLSTCKSPQQMFGALMKTYYAEKKGIDPKDLVVVTVMPCTAKKFEIKRPEMEVDGVRDIDVTITTREFARMVRQAGIMFQSLPDDETFDPMFGIASGAAHIFGATGGVMEAALRTVAEVVTGKPLEKVDFDDVRGTSGIKEATYKVGEHTVRVAVASGTANAKKVLDSVKSGEKHYDFIEIMACPGGCVNGGGQPQVHASVRNNVNVRAERAKALYGEDAGMTLRKSHENPIVSEVYDNYLHCKPGEGRAHHLLHTSYTKRDKYPVSK
ncbi:MAG TPA: iron hydrogenase small subunit [Candidatus Ventrousia excrementavium]|uniref:Iron hydrogenase small subunit n=1 Tax=Candidatus Ventrousia excrementavium TaxID=2840961 RepID=A0A9D1IS10_9CLOT|nr:iron hydrogenase small subunit [Candidatus Ventrousia excrementavium]